jgi:hypothetical protein
VLELELELVPELDPELSDKSLDDESLRVSLWLCSVVARGGSEETLETTEKRRAESLLAMWR